MTRTVIVAALLAGLCLAAAGCGDEPVAGPEAKTKPVVASVNSEVYHRPGCRYVKRIPERNLRGYDDSAHAERRGLRPCKVCKPEEGSGK